MPKPFDLQKALAGKPVLGPNGQPLRRLIHVPEMASELKLLAILHGGSCCWFDEHGISKYAGGPLTMADPPKKLVNTTTDKLARLRDIRTLIMNPPPIGHDSFTMNRHREQMIAYERMLNQEINWALSELENRLSCDAVAQSATEEKKMVAYCKNTRGGLHPSYSSYGGSDGYCFSCIHAGVPEMELEIKRLKDQLVSVWCVQAEEERQRGRKALAFLADIRSKLVNIGIPTDNLNAILDGWKPS